MLQNIRVDIIYYRTPTDFEMEFNLGGCCRMRLLTDKAADRKGLVASLAKAVSRSKVIMGCGPLFGDDGTINVTAAAISHELEVIDNAHYGIKSDGEISVIKGSVPLVTSGGLFGGCIIESGPQTIILLTENKSLRKQLMNELIHPYLEELSIGAQATVVAPALQQEPAAEEVPEETVSLEEKAEETEETVEAMVEAEEAFEETELEEEHNISFETVEDEPAREESQDGETEEIELQKEPEEPATEEPSEEAQTIEEAPANTIKKNAAGDSTFFFDDEEPLPVGKKLNIPIIVLSVMLLLIIAVIVYLIVVVPMLNGQGISEYLRSLFSAVEGTGSV